MSSRLDSFSSVHDLTVVRIIGRIGNCCDVSALLECMSFVWPMGLAVRVSFAMSERLVSLRFTVRKMYSCYDEQDCLVQRVLRRSWDRGFQDGMPVQTSSPPVAAFRNFDTNVGTSEALVHADR